MEENAKLIDYGKQTGYWFMGVTHDKDCIENIKRYITGVKYYFYILHQPDHKVDDDSDNHYHLHFIVSFGGGRSIKQVSNFFDLPVNFIQKVRDIRSSQRYLIHKDNPEKIQYQMSDVVTNHPEKLEIALIDNSDFSISRLFSDLDSLSQGKITRDEFIGLHKVQCQSLPFFQQLSLYARLQEISSASLPDGLRCTHSVQRDNIKY